MPEPHKHHYVPQFYQRGFLSEGSNKLWIYEKGFPPRDRSTRKTGMVIDLYAFQNEKGETDYSTVENELKLIDDQAAKVIQKLGRGKILSEKERTRLCTFVSVMFRRTPKHKRWIDRMALQALPKLLDEIPADRLTPEAKAEVERIRKKHEKEAPSFLFPKGVLRKSVFETEMFKMDWAFFMASATKEFLTCDDPARLNGAGLANKDALIMFPLSKKLLLQCKWHSGWRNDFHQLSDEQVDYFNLWIVKGAQEKVYASQRLEEIRLLVEAEIATMKSL